MLWKIVKIVKPFKNQTPSHEPSPDVYHKYLLFIPLNIYYKITNEKRDKLSMLLV